MKITKSILKKIIREEILKEMMGGKKFAQIRELFSSSEYKKLDNILKAYEIVDSIEDPNEKSLASDYFIQYLGKGAFELAKHYSNPESGERLDLSGLDLSGLYLRGANLDGADLRGTNFTGADLINSSLLEADLTGADLTNSFMTNVRLYKTNFTNANLANVRLLPFRTLAGSIFKGAKWNSKTMINNFFFGPTTGYVSQHAEQFRRENELVQTDEVGPMGAPDDAVLLSDLFK